MFELGDLEFSPEMFQGLEGSAAEKATMILEAVGIQTVAFLRSLTEKMQPAVGGEQLVEFTTADGRQVSFTAYEGSDEQERAAHPGGWADVSGDLARAYAWTVTKEQGGSTLTLSNHMEYAAALEARDGYFVLKGVMDPGGPVEMALREIIRQVAPDWELQSG